MRSYTSIVAAKTPGEPPSRASYGIRAARSINCSARWESPEARCSIALLSRFLAPTIWACPAAFNMRPERRAASVNAFHWPGSGSAAEGKVPVTHHTLAAAP